MSIYQKNLIAVISVLGSILAFIFIQMWIMLSDTHDFVIRHDTEIANNEGDIIDNKDDINKLESRFSEYFIFTPTPRTYVEQNNKSNNL